MAMENIVLNKFYGCVAGWNEFQIITAEGLLQADTDFVRSDDDYINGILSNWKRHDIEKVETSAILAAVPIGLFFTDPDRALEITGYLADRLGKDLYGQLSYSVLAYMTAIMVQKKPKTISAALKRSLLVVCSYYLQKGFAKEKLQEYINTVYWAVWHNDYGLVKNTNEKDLLVLVDALRETVKYDEDYTSEEGFDKTDMVSKHLAVNIWGAFKGHKRLEDQGYLEIKLRGSLQQLAEDLFYKEPYPEDYALVEKWNQKYAITSISHS